MSYIKRKQVSTAIFNAKVTTTVSIALVLFLLGLTILIALAGRGITAFVKEQLSISIILQEDTSSKAVETLMSRLQQKSYVKTVAFISKEQVKQQLIEDLGRDPEEVLGYNPASDCLEVHLMSHYANPDSMFVIEKDLSGMSVVKNVMYDADDLYMVNANLSKIGIALLIFTILLTFISIMLIQNTIRLNIYSRRFLIHTMRLVGATDGFIRRPFVWGMVLSGVVASFLANAGIWAVVYYCKREYSDLLVYILSMDDVLIVWGSVLILGILLTSFASAMAVNRYLRMKIDRYFYV